MTNHPNRSREATANRLSNLARCMYESAGVPGAYVTLTDEGKYRLVEDPNSIHDYLTAAECEYAIRESARQFRADLRRCAMLINYQTAKAIRAAIEAECAHWSAVLASYPRDAIGLTPDAIKFSPEYRASKAAYDTAHAKLRDVNAMICRRFAKKRRAAAP